MTILTTDGDGVGEAKPGIFLSHLSFPARYSAMRSGFFRQERSLWNAALNVVCLACVSGCGILLPSASSDVELGSQLAVEVARTSGVIPDAETTAYLNTLAQRLAGHLPDQRFRYAVRIVDEAEPNAFAAPGGYLFISRGLLMLANSEDELAGVMAHEIIHVDRRHTAKQLARQRFPGLLGLPGRAVGRVIHRDLGALINTPLNLFGGVALASYSRSHELESDRLGQQLAAAAGYDPRALPAFLGNLEAFIKQATGRARKASWFDSHPTTPTRVTELLQQAAGLQWQRRPPVAGDGASFLDKVDGTIVGPNPAQGVLDGRGFYHPDLGFFIQLPEGWQATNNAAAVGAVDPAQDAVFILGLADGKEVDPAKAGAAFVRGIETEFGMQPSRSEPVQIGGLPGYVASFTEASGRRRMEMHFAWVNLEGTLFQMIGLAPEAKRHLLRDAALSFRAITAEERQAVQAARVRVVAAKEGETIEQLSKRTGNALASSLTAVINGLQVDGELKEGQRVKIVRKEPYAAR